MTRPLNPNSIDEIRRGVMWTIEVPDIRLDICSSLYKILRCRRKTDDTIE